MDALTPYLAVFIAAALSNGVIAGIPGAEFVLQAAGLSGIAGTGIAYWCRRARPDLDIGYVVWAVTAAAAGFAVCIQLLLVLT